MTDHQKLPHRHVKSGELVFAEGDASDAAYLLETGSIEVFTHVDGQEQILNTLGPGSLFGELSVLNLQPRSASARAKTDVKLTVVSKQQIQRRLDDPDPVTKLLFNSLLGHLRREIALRQNEELVGATPTANTSDFKAVDTVRLESELELALQNEQIHLHFQPIVNLEQQDIAGMEALIRWQHPERGNVSPEIFMALAEQSDLVLPLTHWVFENGLNSLHQIQVQSGQALFMSFNIDGSLMEQAEFIPWLVELVTARSIKPEQVKLEILERSLVGEQTGKWIAQCREHGFPVALDDFGTGYSSFAFINQFDFDVLKLDRSFVENIEHNSASLDICRSMVIMAQLLGMKVVAEGIENAAEGSMLRGMGCDFGQGYYYAKPMPLDGILDYIKAS